MFKRLSSAIEAFLGTFEHQEDREFLPAALEVVHTPLPPLTRIFAFTLAAFFVAAVIWAFVGRVDIMATAKGRILPAGDIKIIQPLEAGTVRAIHVQDGEHVTAGEVLVELDPTQPQADQERLSRDLLQSRLDVARLEALKNGFLTGSLSLTPVAGASADRVLETRAAMQAQAAQEAAKLADLSQQIAAKESEIAQGRGTITKLSAEEPLLSQKDKVNRDLIAQGYGTAYAAIDSARELADVRNDLLITARKVEQSASERQALVRQREAVEAQYRSDVLSDLRKAQTQVSELEEELVKAKDKSALTILRAPTDGVVEDVAVHSLHGVVLPGQRLMSVVPDTHNLTIEARLENKDVGFVHPGQSVKVKIETFNFTRYGLIEGRVIDVSRDATTDDRQNAPPGPQTTPVENPNTPTTVPSTSSPTYTARIALLQTDMVVDGVHRPLAPGMAVTTEIRTGNRSIADYLLSPIARRTQESLHER